MASACALAIISGIGFLFGIQKSLRAFLNPLFTGGVVEENGRCSAAFCESAALRGSVFALLGANAPALPKGEPLAKPEALQFTR